VAVNPPGRLHPDLLPGAVNATNLALQKAAREAAAVPPVVTPYGQAEAAYREGRAAYEANRPETSLAALRRALAHYPGHLPARELLADQLEMAGQTDEALSQLKQGLAIAPDYTPFRKRAARILLDRDDAVGATGVLIGNGLPGAEDDPELHLLLAGIYLRLGENFLAAQTFRNLLVHNPQAGQLWVGLAEALAADGQPAEARKAYRKALAVGGVDKVQSALVRERLLLK
jgi:tetratricopeptide (TPR) repeat protein